MGVSQTRGPAADFSSRSIFDGEAQTFTAHCGDNPEDEIRATLAELLQAFGLPALQRALRSMQCMPSELSDERLFQALRGYSVIILESKHPKFTAQLVGKIAKMEITTGRRIDLRELGATIGVSKQSVSKQIASLADRLGLPRPDSNEKARLSHRLMNRRNFGSKPKAA